MESPDGFEEERRLFYVALTRAKVAATLFRSGVGWMNYFAFMIIAVFISGLMVGRTPR